MTPTLHLDDGRRKTKEQAADEVAELLVQVERRLAAEARAQEAAEGAEQE